MNTHHYEMISQDQDLLSFTYNREINNYSASMPEERKRLESWDAGFDPKRKLSLDFDFTTLRLPFSEELGSGPNTTTALSAHAIENVETIDSTAEGVMLQEEKCQEAAAPFPMRIRLRRTLNEVIVDDEAETAVPERQQCDSKMDCRLNSEERSTSAE